MKAFLSGVAAMIVIAVGAAVVLEKVPLPFTAHNTVQDSVRLGE